MQDDERCCGTGTCIIDPQGQCWCGQVWDGEKMSRPATISSSTPTSSLPDVQAPEPVVQSQADRI